jgi:hypothetical protein
VSALAGPLAELEARLGRAFASGDAAGLEVLGYGEVSSALRLEADGRSWAAKRLPPFPSRAAFDAYASVFEDYVTTLRARGVGVVESTLHVVSGARGALVAFCVQPLLPKERLAVQLFRTRGEDERARILSRIVELVAGAVDGRVGLDAQLSNWAEGEDGALVLLDVTTPLLRDAAGKERLDTELFLASLPWALRGLVRAFLLRGILATYYEARTVVRDLAANLLKERLEAALPRALAIANERFSPPITEKEVRAYYTDDARTWALLQRLRRADRAWQLGVRRRPYPFLLPGRIER